MRKTLLATLILAALAACSDPATTPQTMAPQETASTAAAPADQSAANPFFAPSTLDFQAPPFDRIKDEHYLPAFEEGMKQHRAEIDAIAAQAEPPTVANTREPRTLASWMAVVPIPLVPPWISRVSPGCSRALSKTLLQTVKKVSGSAAACCRFSPPGMGRHWGAGAVQYSA